MSYPKPPFLISAPFYLANWHCGYCHLEDKEHHQDDLRSVTIGAHLYACPPDLYEALMNRGFRRSGHFLYRNDLLRNCCQLYTIRTSYYSQATKKQFKPSKDQKRCVNKVANFIKADLNNPKNQFDLKCSILNIHKHDSKVFRTRFETASFTKEKYGLYKKYQMRVHDDKESDITEKSFKRFLCSNPLNIGETPGFALDQLNLWYEDHDADEVFLAEGAFHECYYLGDKLIAISVLDILPHSVSSVYFIWDPDYHHLGLGTFSALKDMILTVQINKKHYYLGYYISNNHKMNYKKKFGGELLDLANNKFVDIEYLEKNKILQPGQMFMLQEVEKTLKEEEVPLSSKEMPESVSFNDLYPETWIVPENKKLVNVAERFYGSKGPAARDAKISSENLNDIFEFELCEESPLPTVFDDVLTSPKSNTDDSSDKEPGELFTYQFPSVVPGAAPLWQLQQALVLSRMSISSVAVNDVIMGQLRAIDPSQFTQTDKKSNLNVLRFFGFEVGMSATVIKG